MNGTYLELFNYRLPVPEAVEDKVIARIWSGMESNICDAVNWDVHRLNKDQKETLIEEYIPIFSKRHKAARQKLLYGSWQTDERDNRPPWLHLSPEKTADSDIMSVLRDWEIQDNKSLITEEPGQYIIAKGDVLIPNHAETGLDRKYRGKSFEVIKIIVPIGPWNGGYAEMMVAAGSETKDMPARIKVSPAGIGKTYTEHQNIEQIIWDINRSGFAGVPPYTYDGLAKIIRVLDIEDRTFKYKPVIKMPKLEAPELPFIFPPTPQNLYSHLISEYRLISAKDLVDKKQERDFFTAVDLLISMTKGDTPTDTLMGQMCLSYLTEPDNFRKMQELIYENMLFVVSALESVDRRDIDKKLGKKLKALSAKRDFLDAFIYTAPYSYLPPNMDLLLGDEEAKRILSAIGTKPLSWKEKSDKEWLDNYKYGNERVKLSFLAKESEITSKIRQRGIREKYETLSSLIPDMSSMDFTAHTS